MIQKQRDGMWKTGVFLLFSFILVYISRDSLSDKRSHGFYRFFAWEAILALTILNLSKWFSNWLAWYQLISWILLIICLIPLVLGIYYLKSQGITDRAKRTESSLLGFERTTVLVTGGIYRFIRHPLYSSLFLLNCGIFFKDPSLTGFLLACIATSLLILTAKADESECLLIFGKQYQDYMKTTKRFIPLIY